jgi:Undecaprenyl-phosphate glucose phosphotransferase
MIRHSPGEAAVRPKDRAASIAEGAAPNIGGLVSNYLSNRTESDESSTSNNRFPVLALTDPVILAAVIAMDAVAVFCGSVAGWQLYHGISGMAAPHSLNYVLSAAVLAILFVGRGLSAQVYGHVWGLERNPALLKNLRYFTQAFLVFVTFLVLTRLAADYSRGSLVFQFFICGSTVLALRAAEFRLLHNWRVRRFLVANRVILVGTPESLRQMRNRWEVRQENVQIVKSFPIWLDASHKESTPEYLAAFAEVVVRTSRAAKPDRIVILLPFERSREISFLVERFAELPASVLVSTEPLAPSQSRPEALIVGGLPMLRVIRKPLTAQEQIIKRAFDVIVSATLLLLLAPLLIGVALAIRIDSPGKALFRQSRKGFNQEKFQIFKFRTMRTARPGEAFRQTDRNDVRITRVGSFLRRWNIDELPQLINVLRGEMSLVGPRPHAVEHDDMYYDKIATYAQRHNIKPGITGLAQALGHRGATTTLKQMQDRLDCDVTYIQSWSLFLDFKIMLMTVLSSRAYKNAF